MHMISFLEAHSELTLAEWQKDESISVRFSARQSPPTVPSTGTYRSSPLYALSEAASLPDLGEGTWHIHLLSPRDPYPVLGRILKGAYEGIAASAWFGIGLPTIVIPIQSTDEGDAGRPSGEMGLEHLVADLGDALLAHEEWTVEASKLTHRRLLRRPNSTSTSYVTLPASSAHLPEDVVAILEEFVSSLADATRWSSAYAPDEAPHLELLRLEIATLVTELDWLHSDRTAPAPVGLREYDLVDPLECARLIQQRSDRVVQINSSLSYVVSQAFFGSAPSLASASLIRRHSLLGVGRAHRALKNLTREIEGAFRRRSVPVCITDTWYSFPPLPGFPSGKSCDASEWEDLGLPDVLLRHAAPPDPWKLAYFSGRLGFRESEYSVSAAIQALSSGEAPEWHLSTMTHEMLHGHVRDLLHAVFNPVRRDDPENLDEFWTRVFSRFRDHMLRGETTSFALIDSARSTLLSYCCMVARMGSLTRLPARPVKTSAASNVGELTVPHEDSHLRRLLAEEDKNINEIIVHTLDLFYFYFDNFELYNRSIWASWRSVPAVLRDVRQYALRAMLACTSRDRGDIIGRFARARNQVLTGLTRLDKDLGGEDAVIRRAIKVLELPSKPRKKAAQRTQEANHPLFQPFFASARVVDLARHCFASGRVRGELFHEDVVRAFASDGGTEIDFGMEAGEFIDHPIRSVAEFTAWRARENQAKIGEEDKERLTAWLFVACGSVPEDSEDTPAGSEVTT